MKITTIILAVMILTGCGVGVSYYSSTSKMEEMVRQEQAYKEKLQAELEKAKEEERRLLERLSKEPAGSGSPRPPTFPSAPPPPVPPNTGALPSRPNFYVQPETKMEAERLSPVGPNAAGQLSKQRPNQLPSEFKLSQRLMNAGMAFSVTNKANIDEKIQAQLLIDPNQNAEQLSTQLSVKGITIKQPIKITEVVKATITAPSFVVTEITDESQILADVGPTDWRWELKPTKAGTHEVKLTVSAIVNKENKDRPYTLKTFERTVTVEITKEQIVIDWFKENYKWVITSLLIPLIGFIFKEKIKKWLNL